ncbi:hypothetical protein D9M72_167150 [compost metagenome]
MRCPPGARLRVRFPCKRPSDSREPRTRGFPANFKQPGGDDEDPVFPDGVPGAVRHIADACGNHRGQSDDDPQQDGHGGCRCRGRPAPAAGAGPGQPHLHLGGTVQAGVDDHQRRAPARSGAQRRLRGARRARHVPGPQGLRHERRHHGQRLLPHLLRAGQRPRPRRLPAVRRVEPAPDQARQEDLRARRRHRRPHQGIPRDPFLRHREDRRQDLRRAAQHQRRRVLGLHRHQRHQAGEEAGAARRQLGRLRERVLAAVVAGALPVRGLGRPGHVHRRRDGPRERGGRQPRRRQAQPGAHRRTRRLPPRPDLHDGQPHGADRDGKQRWFREPGHLRPAQPQGARFHRRRHAVLLRDLLRRQERARVRTRQRRQDVQLRPERPLALRGRGQPARHRRAAVLRHAGQLRHPGRADPHPQGGREQPAQPRGSGPRQHPARGRPELLAFGQRPGRDVRQPRLRGQRPRLGQRLRRARGGPRHHQARSEAGLARERCEATGPHLAHRPGHDRQHPAREREQQHLHRAPGGRQHAGGHLQRAAGHRQLPPRAGAAAGHQL